MRPLLPWPALSASARSLTEEDLNLQYILACDAYHHLREIRYGSQAHSLEWLVARMWHGYEGALLFWIGELARQMPADAMVGSRWVNLWGRAYRSGEMAVGPLPWWLGNEKFHLRCQSQLIANDVRYAGQFVYAPLEMAYLWPTEEVGEWQID